MGRILLKKLVFCSLWAMNRHMTLVNAFRLASQSTTRPSSHCYFDGYEDDNKSELNFEAGTISLSVTVSPVSSVSLTATFMSRRRVLAAISIGCTTAAINSRTKPATAIMTDETDNFADNYWSNNKIPASSPSTSTSSSTSTLLTPSDEIIVNIPKKTLQSKEGIGLELNEIEFRTNRRVYVKSVAPGSTAEKFGIKKDWIVVAINGETAERTNVQGVATMIYRSSTIDSSLEDTIELRFRNPVIFRNQLNNLSSSSPDTIVTTQVAPAGDTTQRNQVDGSVKSGRTTTDQDDQRLSVTQLVPPRICKKGATEDDLMEISYVGRVLETGAIFDGSTVLINGEGIPGRGNDISIFLVLGKQPFGQFPPGWDVGLTGICVGERRRLLVPPVLAYGAKGLPRRGIPPNATLQYDVTLVSLNGLATPQ